MAEKPKGFVQNNDFSSLSANIDKVKTEIANKKDLINESYTLLLFSSYF